MKKRLFSFALSFLLVLLFFGCPQTPSTETQQVPINKNSLSTSSGNASIILQEDGTIVIKGANIKIMSSGELMLVGKPIGMNPPENPPENTNSHPPGEIPEEPAENFSRSNNLLSTREIFGIANRNHPISVGGEAQMLPLPTKKGETVAVVILYYNEPFQQGKEIVYPPHHKITINAETGAVIENKAVTPSDFGMSQAEPEPVEGFGLDPNLTSDEFWYLVDRFYAISPAVWQMYKTGSVPNRDILKQYHAIFRRIAKAPLIHYYEAVAPDLFDWLSRKLG